MPDVLLTIPNQNLRTKEKNHLKGSNSKFEKLGRVSQGKGVK
jgi:hypothetical protein